MADNSRGAKKSVLVSKGQAYRPMGVDKNGKMKLQHLGSARKKSNGGSGG